MVYTPQELINNIFDNTIKSSILIIIRYNNIGDTYNDCRISI